MTPQDIITTILGDAPRIADAVSAGAGWEVWMQVEFVLLARARNWQVARETPYPDSSAVLDFFLLDWEYRYPVELKVESATNAGRAVVKTFMSDVEKIKAYTGFRVANRYAVAIGYSGEANHAMDDYAQSGESRFYQRAGYVGVLVQSVPLEG